MVRSRTNIFIKRETIDSARMRMRFNGKKFFADVGIINPYDIESAYCVLKDGRGYFLPYFGMCCNVILGLRVGGSGVLPIFIDS